MLLLQREPALQDRQVRRPEVCRGPAERGADLQRPRRGRARAPGHRRVAEAPATELRADRGDRLGGVHAGRLRRRDRGLRARPTHPPYRRREDRPLHCGGREPGPDRRDLARRSAPRAWSAASTPGSSGSAATSASLAPAANAWRRRPWSWPPSSSTSGAGEILVNSIDHDGTFEGYDLALLKEIAGSVSVPVIACGGAGYTETSPGSFTRRGRPRQRPEVSSSSSARTARS